MALWLLSLCAWGQHQNPFGHALVPDMIADASIEKIGDTFYCYATTDGYGRGLDTSGPPVVWQSKDFMHWSFEGTYFPSAEQEKYWAPSKAVRRRDKWYIYPTVNHYMHVGVADSPDGPFRLARGEDSFEKPFSAASALLQGDDRGGIDAEVFVDEDGQAYAFWGMRHVAKLSDDMMTLGEIHTLQTRRTAYSEGPIFFKRKGIYYYLYTIGGDERYEYYYMMSRTSPLGPYETPAHDLVSTTDVSTGVFGPGHGCVFNDGDDYYFAFLEFGRRSTNRQTYVNRMEFNDDGTIRQVRVTMDGVGALRRLSGHRELKPVEIKASSTRDSLKIRHNQDERCQRTEYFDAAFAIDGANGSRWMAQEDDAFDGLSTGSGCWLMVDLGQPKVVYASELYFVRPTAGHAYILEGSTDGIVWEPCGGHKDIQKRSPHRDLIQKPYRFLRVTITEGVKGVWEWRLLSDKEDEVWGDWQEWGEASSPNPLSKGQGGMYRNPIVPADYSDLDCIRVGDDYYAISSTMQFSPGMTILHSRDLVNWEMAGHAVSDLSEISGALTWKEMDRYGRGVWAGTLRYHKGRFYVFFGTPDEGYFMTSAARAEGPWEPLTPLLTEAGWDDCTAIWDKRGKGYFVGTCFKDGYKTYIFDMAADGKSINRNSARLINEGNGREANKLIYHKGYYYLVFSEHKNGIGRYVMAKRDKKLTGPFKEEKQLLLPCREANEPNQGGIIEGKDGQWYFLTHHGSGDWSGRVMSLLPVQWIDGWPMIGSLPSEEDGGRGSGQPGSMVWQGKMPVKVKSEERRLKNETLRMQQSDDFDAAELGPQWQWNYEPRKEMFSLSERPGWLRLKAFMPLKPGVFLKAGNTLTQRSFRTPHNEVIVKLDISHTADGLHAGLVHFASQSASLGIVNRQGQNYLEFTRNDASTGSAQNARRQGIAIPSSCLWLKSSWGLDGKSTFYYSFDGHDFIEFGQYQLSWGYYRGDRIGIYCYNDLSENGFIDVDYLNYK